MIKKYPFLVGVALAIALLLVSWRAVAYQFGGIRNCHRYIQGSNYAVHPTTIDVGQGPRGEKRTTSVSVRNISFSPIRIVGAITTCNCVDPVGLPITIPPRCIEGLQFTIFLESSKGKVEQMVTLLIDDGQMQRVPVIITGSCTPGNATGKR